MKIMLMIMLAMSALVLTACPDVEDGAIRIESHTEVKADNVYIVTDPETAQKIRVSGGETKTTTKITENGETTTTEETTKHPAE